jgi:four helix bundle protein
MKFEKLSIWSRAVDLSTEIYRYSCQISDFGFRDQLTRSGLSIPSNIAEGIERESIKESISFLNYAKASAGELYTQVVIGAKAEFIDEITAERWMKELNEIAAILATLINKRRKF